MGQAAPLSAKIQSTPQGWILELRDVKTTMTSIDVALREVQGHAERYDVNIDTVITGTPGGTWRAYMHPTGACDIYQITNTGRKIGRRFQETHHGQATISELAEILNTSQPAATSPTEIAGEASIGEWEAFTRPHPPAPPTPPHEASDRPNTSDAGVASLASNPSNSGNPGNPGLGTEENPSRGQKATETPEGKRTEAKEQAGASSSTTPARGASRIDTAPNGVGQEEPGQTKTVSEPVAQTQAPRLPRPPRPRTRHEAAGPSNNDWLARAQAEAFLQLLETDHHLVARLKQTLGIKEAKGEEG